MDQMIFVWLYGLTSAYGNMSLTFDVQVVNYRDHPPQDSTYVCKFHPFTSDIPDVQNYLKGLTGMFCCFQRWVESERG